MARKRTYGERQICPICQGGTYRPVSIDLEQIEEYLQYKYDWTTEKINLLKLRLEQEGLLKNTGGIPWLYCCYPCSMGWQRCETCGRPCGDFDQCFACRFPTAQENRGKRRDTQRQRVYDNEWRIFRKATAVRWTMEEAEKAVRRLSRRFGISVPVVNELPRSSTKGGDYNSNRIRSRFTLKSPTTAASTIVHEFAHHLVHKLWSWEEHVSAHGPEFVRAMYEAMVAAGFPPESAPAYSRWKMRIGKAGDFSGRVRSSKAQQKAASRGS